MPVTGWRRPALAPVYALITAFAVVVGIGLLTTKPVLVAQVDDSGPNATVKIVDESGQPVDTDVRVETTKAGRVQIVFAGEPTEPAELTLRDKTSEEIAMISGTGPYQPRRSLQDQTVCVRPPLGWVVRTQQMVKRDDDVWCTQAAITKPAEDIEISLAEGGLR